MSRALFAVALLATIAAALTIASRPGPEGDRPRRVTSAASPRSIEPARTPGTPQLPRTALDRQDRTSAAQRRRESHALDDRPLLTRLPLRFGGVTIDIAGLAADGHTSTLVIDRGPRTRVFASAVYRRALATYHDDGRAYRLRWTR
jgi:hypothetical protein